MKHKHYDMIVAKAANMELVVFVKTCENGAWYEKSDAACQWWDDSEYFICLPEHNEDGQCLHWLNGGDAEENYNSEWSGIERHEWHDQSVFYFDDGYSIRIKPKKEKRWIAFNTKALMTTRDTYTSGVECEDALNKVGEIYENHPWQFIEIEVEV